MVVQGMLAGTKYSAVGDLGGKLSIGIFSFFFSLHFLSGNSHTCIPREEAVSV
jgi:hypothetical protein